MSERHFDSQRDRDALDRHITREPPEPDDFPTREQHERISALAIEFAPEAVRVDPDVDGHVVRVEVGTLGRAFVFDENGDDVTDEHRESLAARIAVPLDVLAALLGAKVVAEALTAAEASWGAQRTMIEATLANKLAEPFVAALREHASSIRGEA
jgi:hypothetical protein